MSKKIPIESSITPSFSDDFQNVKSNKKEHQEEKIILATNSLEKHYDKLTRVEAIMLFAKKIGAKKIGLAYCHAMRNETQLFANILEMHGFTIFPISCKTAKNTSFVCDPIIQAKSFNKIRTDLNILIGLCIGNDALFTKYSSAITAHFILKDHILGHNPLLGLYMSNDYDARSL